MKEIFYKIRTKFKDATLDAKIDNNTRAKIDDILKKVIDEQLTLTDVSQQRELLKAYTKWLDDKLRDSDELDELMDDYFRSL